MTKITVLLKALCYISHNKLWLKLKSCKTKACNMLRNSLEAKKKD